MKIIGIQWKSMKIHEIQWKSMKINEFQWKSIKISEIQPWVLSPFLCCPLSCFDRCAALLTLLNFLNDRSAFWSRKTHSAGALSPDNELCRDGTLVPTWYLYKLCMSCAFQFNLYQVSWTAEQGKSTRVSRVRWNRHFESTISSMSRSKSSCHRAPPLYYYSGVPEFPPSTFVRRGRADIAVRT